MAPLHNPANLIGIEASEKFFPNAVQVAVFDTAFFATLPEHAYRYAIPKNSIQIIALEFMVSMEQATNLYTMKPKKI